MTTNKFKFLPDDETEDPFETLVKAEQIKKDKPLLTKKEKKATVAKPVIAVPPAKAEPEKQQQHRQANKENESRENRGAPRGGAQRGGRGGNRVNFAERKDAGNRQADGIQDVIADRFGETRPVRGGGGRGTAPGGRGGFRGPTRRGMSGRGSGGGDRYGDSGRGGDRHEDTGFRSGGEADDENRGNRGGVGRFRGGWRRGFSSRGDHHVGRDRHSGSDRTGIKPTTKREGHGKGNWGTENDELVGETEPIPVNDSDIPKSEDHVETEFSKDIETDEPKREEEKNKELTLDEWKALHQKVEPPVFQIRRAGEGQDQKIYSKLVPLKKEEEPEEHEEIVYVRREPREKPLNIEVSFSDANRPRGGPNERGFRGARDREDFRGGRGGDKRDFRGVGRGGRRAFFALNDEAFPALGGKA